MTEVLPAPQDGASYFASSHLPRTPSRNASPINTTNTYVKPTAVKTSFDHPAYPSDPPTSAASSAPSSPQLSHSTYSQRPSYTSTPASSLSLDFKGDGENDGEIDFPLYEKSVTLEQVEEVQEPEPLSGIDSKAWATNLPKDSISHTTRKALDDQAIESEPTRHVDYLAHEWRLEDIWASWRYVVARRKVYSNSVRLENASWRTWAKAKDNLRTITPEALNWLKDCDVTWLYGPLQTDTRNSLSTIASPPPSRLSTSSSFLHKKPILKKKSASEAILQRSISDHSLLKQAGDILKCQEATPAGSRPSFERATSDFTIRTYCPVSTLNTPAGEDSQPPLSRSYSLTSSGLQSPAERRHISFNDEVVQCIAVDSKDDDDEEEERSQPLYSDEDDEEDDGLVMMKQVSSKGKISNRSTPRGSFSNDSKTIAPLPSTTLKYRSDTPEPPEAKQPYLQNAFWPTGHTLSPSPSQETLRPSRPSANFLIDDDEDYPDLQWQPSYNGYNDSCPKTAPLYRPDESAQAAYDPGPGMRRTPSGMFMPYDEDEDEAAMNSGLFGKVIDTVNTARDIAHVIWNVGWRR